MTALLAVSCLQQEKPSGDETEVVVNPFVENSVDRDMEDIREDGVLKALVVYSSTSYFLYRGQTMGFEYEMLTRLADHLDLKLELVVADNLDNKFEVLNRGDVDLIAHNMTVTNQRKWEVDFTDYLYLTRQVLVQKKPDNYMDMTVAELQEHLIQEPLELAGKTVSIRKNASYIERVLALSNEIGGEIFVDTLDSQLSTDEIIWMVEEGKIEYTIADENLAKIQASYSPILDISVPVSFPQQIAWVVRKKSPELKAVLNEWIRDQRKKSVYFVIYNKYFENERTFQERISSEYFSVKNNKISQYDELIKQHARKIGWDWRMIAALIYQESRFNPRARSWVGAEGLMQIMPGTARALGVRNTSDPAQSIRGGTNYLQMLYERFEDIPDSLNRLKFTMASYNCGYGHVRDAQRLAEENNLDPNIWFDNVEEMIIALSYPRNYNLPFIQYGYVRGREPAAYVEKIMERYERYSQLITLE
jgi:membrane-bound lytic murein transglycosylase F